MHSPCAAQCHLAVCHRSSRPSRLTWGVTLNHWMVVHLESGIATTAREAYYVVLAIVYSDGGLINGDVICSHVEDDPYLSLILWVYHNNHVKRTFNATTVAKVNKFHHRLQGFNEESNHCLVKTYLIPRGSGFFFKTHLFIIQMY